MSDYIESTSGTRGGKPRISGTRITVADIVLMHRRLGRALEEIAGTYDLPLAAVYAAMAYYYDHKDEIDQSLDHRFNTIRCQFASAFIPPPLCATLRFTDDARCY